MVVPVDVGPVDVFGVNEVESILVECIKESHVVCSDVNRSVAHGILIGLAYWCGIYMPGSRKEECIMILF